MEIFSMNILAGCQELSKGTVQFILPTDFLFHPHSYLHLIFLNILKNLQLIVFSYLGLFVFLSSTNFSVIFLIEATRFFTKCDVVMSSGL